MSKLDVFISNAGGRSRRLAETLREWLPLVINDLEPWVASQDIAPGRHWLLELQKRMSPERRVFCLLIVTPENMLQHWLHFEMGAMLRTAPEGAVVPVLFDLIPDELRDPIRQYNGVVMDEDGMRKLVQTLNAASGNTIQPDQLRKAFHNNWPDLAATIAAERSKGGPEPTFSIAANFGLSVRRREYEVPEGNRHFQHAESAKVIAMTYESLGAAISSLRFPNLERLSLHVYALQNLLIDHPTKYRVPDRLRIEWSEGVRKTIEGFLDEVRCPRLVALDVVIMSVAPSLTGTSVCWRDGAERGEHLRMTFAINGSPPDETQTITVTRTTGTPANDGEFSTFQRLFDNVGRVLPPQLVFPVIREGYRRPVTDRFIESLMRVCNHPVVGVNDRGFSVAIRATDTAAVEGAAHGGTALWEWLERHPRRAELRVRWREGVDILDVLDDQGADAREMAVRGYYRYAAFLLMTHGTRVLMINHPKGEWDLDIPGGKVAETDVCERDTLVRELFEELSFELDTSVHMPCLGFVFDPKSSREHMPVIAQYFHYPLTDKEHDLLQHTIRESTKRHEIKWLDIAVMLNSKLEHRAKGNDIEGLCHAPTHVVARLAEAVSGSGRQRALP